MRTASPDSRFADAIAAARRGAVACADRAFMTASRLAVFDRALFDREADEGMAAETEAMRWSLVELGIDAPAQIEQVGAAMTRSFAERAAELLAAIEPRVGQDGPG